MDEELREMLLEIIRLLRKLVEQAAIDSGTTMIGDTGLMP